MSFSYVHKYMPLIFALIYLPLVIVGNLHVTICITEDGEMQFEYGNCASDALPAGTSITANTCGDCSDAQLKAGDTQRFNNNYNIAQPANILICQIREHITPNISSHTGHWLESGLIGTSILIV